MEQNTTDTSQNSEFADDLLMGAEEIGIYLFGSKNCRRRVYYLAECTRIPLFRLGSTLCARKSVLQKWVSDQEHRAR